MSRDNYEDRFSTMPSGSLDKMLTIIMSQNTELAIRKFAALGAKIHLGKASNFWFYIQHKKTDPVWKFSRLAPKTPSSFP